MSQGYVKTLARQMSTNDKLSPSRIDQNSGGSDSGGRSDSPSPIEDEGIQPNLVQSLIKAAEQHKNNDKKTSTGMSGEHFSLGKRPSLPNTPTRFTNGSSRKLSSPDTSSSRGFTMNTYRNKQQERSPQRINCTLSKPNKPSVSSSPSTSPSNLRKISSSSPKPPTSPRPNQNNSSSSLSVSSSSSSSSSPPSSLPLSRTSSTSRKLSATNSSTKPSIPNKPPFLKSLSQGKDSTSPARELETSTNNRQQETQSTNNSSTNDDDNNDNNKDDEGPIYAQVNKNKNKDETEVIQNGDRRESSSDCLRVNNVILRNGGGERVRRDSEQYRDSVIHTIYDNAAALSAAELFDSSWSDSDSYKDLSEEEADGADTEKKEEGKIPEDSKIEGSGHGDKCYKIANELLKTEQDYVDVLHLLHEIFYTRLEKANSQQLLFPPDVLNHIFSNTKSIYFFHNGFILPQLQARMEAWDSNPRIGDLMKKNAPFLKMYSEYIYNFSQAMKLLKDWSEKSAKFSNILQEIQKLPACGNLSLQHHMLGPIQRVPRYELLLKDYIKHLPADSLDMNDAQEALDLVTKAASHSNQIFEKIETFRKLLDIYQNLRGVTVNFISPTREFVMQGPITKISARSGDKQPRYIFLFNDLVLICTQLLLGAYNVRCEMQVENMEIKSGHNMNIKDTFIIHSKQKAVEFLDETTEPLEWIQKIQKVIETYKNKKRSIKQDSFNDTMEESSYGTVAPKWIPDDAATMCMLCGTSFNTFMRRRHHCRSCGKLVCRSCCNKAPLEYMQGKIERVCQYCYDVIVHKRDESASESSVSSTTEGGVGPKKKGSVKAKVKASDPGLVSSYLQCSEDGGKTWQRLWISAHSDYVLYSFKAHEDVSSVSAHPLPGYVVITYPDTESRTNTFGIKHKKKCLMFQADKDKKKKRWVAILEKLIKAELPDDSLRFSTQSDSSNNSSSSETGITIATSDQDDASSHLDCRDLNDDKADVRSQYDNVDP